MANGGRDLIKGLNDLADQLDEVARRAGMTPQEDWEDNRRNNPNPAPPYGLPPFLYVKLGHGMNDGQFDYDVKALYRRSSKNPDRAKLFFRPFPPGTTADEITFVGPERGMSGYQLAQKTIDRLIALEEEVDFPNNLTPEQRASLDVSLNVRSSKPGLAARIAAVFDEDPISTKQGGVPRNAGATKAEPIPGAAVRLDKLENEGVAEGVLDHELVVHYDYTKSIGHFIIELKDNERQSLFFGKYADVWRTEQVLKEFMPKVLATRQVINEFQARLFAAAWKDIFAFVSGRGMIRDDKERIKEGILTGKIVSSRNPALVNLRFFKLTKEKYGKILDRIETLKKSPTRYVLTESNCADFAQKILGGRAKLEDLFDPEELARSGAGLYVACRQGPNERCKVPADSPIWPLAEKFLF